MTLKVSSVEAVVTVAENASLLSTSNAEVSTRFDSKRLSELPLAPNRNVFNVALSAAGVSQLGSGQTGFSAGLSYSSNGGRVRSNNFMLDSCWTAKTSTTRAWRVASSRSTIPTWCRKSAW